MPRRSTVSRSAKDESVEEVRRAESGRGSHVFQEWEAEATEEQPVVYVARTEAVKAKLLTKKKKELEAVVDRHDTLVRELFHLETFVSMLQYDPKVAKEDTSEVFQQHQAKFDLFDKALPTSSRPTRSNRAEKLEMLKLVKPTKASRSVAPVQSSSRLRRKSVSTVLDDSAKQRDPLVVSNQSISVTQKQKSTRSSTLQRDREEESAPTTESISVGVRRKHESQSHGPDASAPEKRRRVSHSALEAPSLNRRSLRSRHTISEGKGVQDSIVTAPPVNGRGSKVRTEETPSTPALLLSPSKIKRIKLLVRRPAATLTNPVQIPPQPRFNKSLQEYFESFTLLDDRDVNKEELQTRADADISLLKRVQEFKNQGRFIPGAHVFIGQNAVNFKKTVTPERKEKDHWDHVMAEAAECRRLMLGKMSGQYVAAQIAAKIKVYWEGQAAKKDKQRQQEEKRLRALAKATIKMVTNEWKKAVFYIREQERLKQQAEERRRGHEHLDAILDQSEQILETQHLDLSRPDRSRTSSVSWGSQGGDSDDEDTDDEDEQEEQEGSADEESEREDATADTSEDDCDTAQLLLGRPLQPTTQDMDSETATPSSEPLDFNEEDDFPDGSSDQLVDELMDDSPTDPISNSSPTLVPVIQPDATESDLLPQTPRPTTRSPQKEGDSLLLPPRTDETVTSIPDPTSPTTPSATQKAPLPTSGSPQGTPSPKPETTPSIPTTTPSIHNESLPDDPNTPASLNDILPDDDVGMGDSARENEAPEDQIGEEREDPDGSSKIPHYLKPFAVAPVDWDVGSKIVAPSLLRGVLRPYQQAGLEWLASLHTNNLNGILADEMGLGKTIQTISLLAHLACDRGIWGPHLIIVPTSVLLNWEMEFKKFLPGFRVLAYHGSTKRRKELRQGWNDKFNFNVCITSYALASRDAHIFKRKAWYYMILDEAHMIKNFKSQRWNILLMFRSFRRLLLTGTPLQNNLTELWALLQFLMSGSHFANLKEFADWFSNPLEKAIEAGDMLDDEILQRVSKLHTVLRPYLLRRIKRDVEKELPSKFEHIILCPLSKRQRFLYDEFMARAQTRDALQSGVYQKIANILMQLRKVCNHPDLFEVRPIITSFAMERSAIADFEIKELLVRRRLLEECDEDQVNFELLGLHFLNRQDSSQIGAIDRQRLDASPILPHANEDPGIPPPPDYRTISGFAKFTKWTQRAKTIARWTHIGYVNRLRCSRLPIYSSELLSFARSPPPRERERAPWEVVRSTESMVQSWESRSEAMSGYVGRFAFVTPQVVAPGIAEQALSGAEDRLRSQPPEFDQVLHKASVKLQIAFPDPSLLQYDCGKLQTLATLLREKQAGGHRVLIFTQMTRVLDILEIFLNFNGYLYLRLDGATKIEDRQYITERFNADPRVFAFIASSRSGGVGINLTGADTVIFYDSDFNPQMDKQCEDRAHRIGQIRDVHIYRLVSQHTVEEALLRKANQKRSLDDLVIQQGEFDWRTLFNDESALSKALEEFEDREDVHAAAVAAREEFVLEGADEADFGGDVGEATGAAKAKPSSVPEPNGLPNNEGETVETDWQDEADDEGGTIAEYMVSFAERDWDYFREWRV